MSGHQGGETSKASGRASVLKQDLQRGETKGKKPTTYTPEEIEAKQKERAYLLELMEQRKQAKYAQRHNEIMGVTSEIKKNTDKIEGIKKDTEMILRTLGAASSNQEAPAPETPKKLRSRKNPPPKKLRKSWKKSRKKPKKIPPFPKKKKPRKSQRTKEDCLH